MCFLNRRSLGWLTLASFWWLLAPPTLPAQTELRILSYNIHHGAGTDGKLDLERIARTILAVKPDLVALQEVDVNTDRTGQVDQARELARLTKMHVAFGGNIKLGTGDYGNAVLSRFPITKSKNLPLPNHRQGEQRGLLQVTLQPGFLDRPVEFWCTHWDHRKDESERVASAKLINQALQEASGDWHFLAGDLNDTVGSQAIDEIEKHWRRSNSTPLPTIPVEKPTRQIDFVYASRKTPVEAIQTKVLTEAVASDHRAILAVYRLKM